MTPPAAKKPSGVEIPWHRAQLAPVMVIKGSEPYFISKAIDKLLTQAREVDTQLERTVVEAAGYLPGMLATWTSPSLFGERRFIQILNLQQATVELVTELESYFKQPEEDVWLVLQHEAKGNTGKKVLTSATAAAGGAVFSAAPLEKEKEKLDFVAAEFSRARRRISTMAAQNLVAAVGSNTSELAASCAQLMSDVSSDVTEEHVDKYYGGRAEVSAFKISDALLNRQFGEAIVLIRQALATGVDAVPIIAVIALNFRALLKAQAVDEGLCSVRETGLQPWQFNQRKPQLRKWSSDSLSVVMQLIAEADHGVKGGSRAPLYTLERLVVSISRSPMRY